MANPIPVSRAEPRVLSCACRHPYQDRRYGPGRRSMNPTARKFNREVAVYRCTVCRKEHEV